jgi:hypothetical protein
MYVCIYIYLYTYIYIYIHVYMYVYTYVHIVQKKILVDSKYAQLYDDDDVYLDKLQTRGVKKSILYI